MLNNFKYPVNKVHKDQIHLKVNLKDQIKMNNKHINMKDHNNLMDLIKIKNK